LVAYLLYNDILTPFTCTVAKFLSNIALAKGKYPRKWRYEIPRPDTLQDASFEYHMPFSAEEIITSRSKCLHDALRS